MAPLQSKSRTRPATFPIRTSSHNLSSTKRDKRQVRHSLLLSRVSKTAPGRKVLKRGRKVKAQLKANLSSLIDALPEEDGHGKPSAAANVSGVKTALEGGTSIASRRGLQKRREEVGRAEKERFGRNLAVMAVVREKKQGNTGTQETADGGNKGTENNYEDDGNRAERWEALRRHIQQSMAAQGS